VKLNELPPKNLLGKDVARF